MFNQGVKAYQDVGVHTAVSTANPVQIVVLLYEGAMAALQTAKGEMSRQNTLEKSRLLMKAIDIIEGLRGALDFQQGGDISVSLSDLYLYMVRQVSLANLRNDPALLDEVHQLLGVLLEAWKVLADNGGQGSGGNPATPS